MLIKANILGWIGSSHNRLFAPNATFSNIVFEKINLLSSPFWASSLLQFHENLPED